MLWRRIFVGVEERLLIIKNGRFGGILMPGEYRLFATSGVSLDTEKHDIRDLVFRSRWAEYLVKERPQLVQRHFIQVETSNAQVAMVYVNGSLFQVLVPAKRLLFWRGIAHISAEIVDVISWPQRRERKSQSLGRRVSI